MAIGEKSDQRVQIGRVVAVFGVRGWVKLESYTRPAENLLKYTDWCLSKAGKQREVRLVSGRSHGKIFVAQLADVGGQTWNDRDQAAELIGAEISVLRKQLPKTKPGEYYWTDLIGLQVEHLDGRRLGEVSDLMETGAHDVLVVRGERERLIPFVKGPIVQQVDLQARLIRVDWDPEF